MKSQNLPRWEVALIGDESDLSHLVANFHGVPCRIWRDEKTGQVLMQVDGFAADARPRDVLESANVTVQQIAGVLKVVRGSVTAIRVGGVMLRESSEVQHQFLFASSLANVSMWGDLTVLARDASGSLIENQSPPPKTLTLAKIMAADAAVAKAMRLHASNDAATWVGLYRLYEVIKHDVGGERAMVLRGWVSKAQQDRYRHSSNSPDAAGDHARHGATNEAPPAHPMTLDDARSFVDLVLHAWLNEKLNPSS